MKTGNVEYFRGIYELQEKRNSATTREFKLINTDIIKSCDLFTEILRVEKDNGFHDRSRHFDYWLYLRNTTNWKRCYKSGLAITPLDNIFEGNLSKVIGLEQKTAKGKDFENPEHFIVVQTLDSWNTFVLDIFPGFYPVKKALIRAILKEHTYLLRIKKGA